MIQLKLNNDKLTALLQFNDYIKNILLQQRAEVTLGSNTADIAQRNVDLYELRKFSDRILIKLLRTRDYPSTKNFRFNISPTHGLLMVLFEATYNEGIQEDADFTSFVLKESNQIVWKELLTH